MVYQLTNPNNNQHLTRYNEICSRDYSQFDEKLSLHHILSRSKFPELKNDKQNHSWLPTLIHVEASKLKRIREQQLLSVNFIAEQLDVEPNFYKEIEDEKMHLSKLGAEKVDFLIKLLGVDYSDIDEYNISPAIEVSGLAITYKGLSEKDIVEVGRLFNYRQMINNELFG